jgi:predicted nucleic-acid-binding Zn-ribbon protein
MKASGTCSKCACTTIYVVAAAATRGLRLASYEVIEMPVGAHEARVVPRTGGEVEAFICAQCGFTELFAVDLPDLARLAAEGKLVTIRRGAHGAAPYR